eukprot:428066_1
MVILNIIVLLVVLIQHFIQQTYTLSVCVPVDSIFLLNSQVIVDDTNDNKAEHFFTDLVFKASSELAGIGLILYDDIPDGLDSNIIVVPYGKYITSAYLKTGDNAETFCMQTFGTHLATIGTVTDNQAIKNYCNARHGTVDKCWIGINDKQTEGIWKWSSGWPVSYNNWAIGQPNNYNNQDCVQTEHGKWSDWGCQDSNVYVK